jgi:hypothetical protein
VSKEDNVLDFCNFLRKEGYLPSVDEDGDVVFKFEGRTYLVLLDDKDDEFFRLVFPGFWEITSEEERIMVERAALTATAETKVAKVFPVRDNTWATIELFVPDIESAQRVFNRSLRALQTAVRTFVEQMQK